MEMGMLNDDDVFVVIIESDEEDDTRNGQGDSLEERIKEVLDKSHDPIEIKQITDVTETKEVLEFNGSYVDPKQLINESDTVENECRDDDDSVYENESFVDIKQEREEPLEQDCSDDDDVRIHRYKKLPLSQQKSLVKELKKQFPDSVEGKVNSSALVETLAEIMRRVKAPPLPRDYYIMNGIHFECTVCGEIKETYAAIGRHYQEKHGPRYLLCYGCGVDFRSTTNLYKHEKRCISPDIKLVLKARAEFLGRKARNRPFRQNTDSFLCQYRILTDKHQKQSPPLKERATFACNECSAVYISRTALVSHINMHRGESPYKCMYCTAAYTSQSALSRHQQTHSEAQYICNHCERVFKTKKSLTAHLDTHLPERKYPCQECDKRYAQKSALLLHINKVHRNLPPPFGCQLCPRRFPRMPILKDHMKKEHGMVVMTREMFFRRLPKLSETQLQQAKVVLKSDSYAPAKENNANNNDLEDPEKMLAYLVSTNTEEITMVPLSEVTEQDTSTSLGVI